MGLALQEIVNVDGLTKLFEKKPISDANWRCVNYIQTVVKAPVGVGKPIFVNFYAPIDEQAIESLAELDLINYNPNDEPISLL